MAQVNSIEYRPIEGFPGYRVGSDGSVWSCWWPSSTGASMMEKWRKLKPFVHKKRGPGRTYLCVDIVREGKRHSFLAHRLILESFVGLRPEGMECRHLDGNPFNNALANLCWGTKAENTADTRKFERFHTKLTAEQVNEIRVRYAAGGITQQNLAAMFGTTRPNVSNIINGASWRHLLEESSPTSADAN